jgi:hypothetical protein
MKTEILGTPWNIVLYTDDKLFLKEVADGHEDTEALTDPDTNTIYIRKSRLSVVNIRHELFHAYIVMCCAAHSDIERDSLEEIACEIVGRYGARLVEQANEIYNEFKEEHK